MSSEGGVPLEIVQAPASNASGSGIEEGEPSIERKYLSKDLIFVGKGNPQPSKYVIIPQAFEDEVKTFADEFLLKGLEDDGAEETESTDNFFPSKPGVLISVTGGAQDFYMHSSKLEQVFNRGLLKAAQNISAWIVDGGLDAGVMQYVGKAIKEMAVDDVPCIGIATHKMVILNEMLSDSANSISYKSAEYVANQPNTPNKCALNPNHTHFILVDSAEANWGKEIKLRSALEEYIRSRFEIPVVLIVVNGGPGTLETVAQGAEKNFAIVVVEGSGRACDAIAALVKKAQKLAKPNEVQTCAGLMAAPDDTIDLSPWLRLLAEAKGDQKKIATWTNFMDRILKNYKTITLFDANGTASADMDIFILRAILSSPGRRLTLAEKLNLGVVWNRVDIIKEILDTEKEALSSGDQRRALNEALEQALLLDRPKIFSVLAEKGAQKEFVNLRRLYFYKELKNFFRRIPAYAQTKSALKQRKSGMLPLPANKEKQEFSDFSKDNPKNRTLLKEVLRAAGTAFAGYQPVLQRKFDALDDTSSLDLTSSTGHTIRKKKKKITFNDDARASFTDFLIWAVFLNRFDLAKAIWQRTTLPVHSALIACQLYRFLANTSTDKDEYMQNSDWFEEEAIKLMDKLDYEDIKDVLIWEWTEMGHLTALDIAGDANCKKFVGHAHVQSLLDEMFYSDDHGKIEPSTSSYQIWLTIIVPPLIYSIYKRKTNYPNWLTDWVTFYYIPIVKFWTNTMFYCGFLFAQAWVLTNLQLDDHSDTFLPAEYVLWVWVIAMVVEELVQFGRDTRNHFAHLSNQMDALLLVLHLAYMILRWIQYAKAVNGAKPEDTDPLFLGAANVLIVACIFSWTRLLNVFAINHSLGPLFFIIIRLFKDIFLWIFVFLLFAISFQFGFANLTMQAGADPTSTYPTGSLPVSFFTIIGDFGYINDTMADTKLGITLIAVYALIAQVMLVNLLIAMMGDTYSNVSENSMEEWKFYRLEMVMENQTASFQPPPTNLLMLPFDLMRNYKAICRKTNNCCTSPISDEEPLVENHPKLPFSKSTSATRSGLMNNDDMDYDLAGYDIGRVLKKMKLARDEVIDEERIEDETSVISIVNELQGTLRTLTNERENDRTFLEKRFKDLELLAKANPVVAAANPAAVPVQNPAMQVVQELQATIATLYQSNQSLTQQNAQILGLLQQQQAQQQQLFQQLQLLQARSVPEGNA